MALLKPAELSFPLPKSPHVNLHIHLTCLATSTLVFLTTTSIGDSNVARPMGSFVYAMPDNSNEKSTICSTLYSSPASIDYATRTARVLARRMKMPVYVGCSADFSGMLVEEETEGLTKVVNTIMAEWEKQRQS
ncbi:hypothetical protein H112_01410 [Trichophyton rubrum D6]|uniref:Proteasome assembly chaperone 4 n=2 Tax=Trichophyton TaxID=5550 RepID=A0A022WDH1_TRIRU|nr:hypothetical protein H100_01405 [Trichophyton rubrum MR850]EZF45519.1 hypothetical protein H102_01400 [Trichophyton rubrum CBS 100081]EZF56166.1 hypothetical protein H103_01410 [Trichophyton rubrum CBS 288.86]EZF66705.1 hypothetical protein H104_01390 [Trichophyton rubrum CBS 289.86]EZF77410.1 hypothetical protein H105_01420 [Trichophyton soudanense CBS 452.61]EZF88065.1 hypothetical protein H110_01409 [Trichophyton rubrum MR1448]EZF98855.1 hypothetical protein H113_01415 [Trichophyton rub